VKCVSAGQPARAPGVANASPAQIADQEHRALETRQQKGFERGRVVGLEDLDVWLVRHKHPWFTCTAFLVADSPAV
jgi:hypothetical protein